MMKSNVLLFVLAVVFNIDMATAQTQPTSTDSVTINGRVTDYENHPLNNVSVSWARPDFSEVSVTLTDKNGNYTIRLPKGKYHSMGALNMDEYIIAKSTLPDEDQRLEFWGWDFIADRDTTLNIQYHRMEAYGLRAFRIPGATPAYQIYVRPMSLTRAQAWMKAGKPKAAILAPKPEQLKAIVWINGEEVPILMKQEIKEYFAPDEWGNAYLLTVDLPKKSNASFPYHIFKVELTDLENGDRGEAIYYMEKETYVK